MASLAAHLDRFGLGKYAALFQEHDIDVDVLGELTDADLEKLGISLGDRRRILKAAREIATPPASPSVPGQIPQSQPRTAERRQLTVMFTDLVGSTQLSAALDPEELRDVIAQYQKHVSDEVARFGGYVAKPLGDGLLIYFGWPQAHEDDAERALHAAAAALSAIRRLATPAGRSLAARIGIATGEVVVGDFIGGGVDEEGAVVGETPNLAARLQGLGGENAIVVSDATRRLVGNRFEFTDLGPVRVAGLDAPIRAWRLQRELASESRFHALHGGRLGRLIGRDHEIGFLLERWNLARDGESQLVLISGEAGIGKSRLVAEAVGLCGAEQRMSYQASPLHRNTALHPVLQQLETQAGFEASDEPREKLRKLGAVVPGTSAVDRAALAYIAELMSLHLPAHEPQEAKPSAEIQRDAALESLARVAEEAATAAPLLIVVEDAHWLDATTLEFVERLLMRLNQRPAMLLVTFRPEFIPPWAHHGRAGMIALSRLGRKHALAIVNSRMPEGETLPPEIADDIVAKSDGVPLFVEELTGSVLEAERSDRNRAVQIPTTLRDALTERLDRLGSAKEVAQIGAAIGREFSSDTIMLVLNRSEASLQQDLDRLMSIEVVFRASRSERSYVFKHALLQDAAYQSMLKGRRREVHARIVEALLKQRPGLAESEPEVLATHLERAGRDAEAAAFWRKAGKIALQKSAYREAIGAFNNALRLAPQGGGDTPDRIDTNRAIATAYFAVADTQSVRRHLDQAIKEAATTDNRVLVAEIAIQQCHVLNIFGGRISDAREAGKPALAIATELNDDQLAYGARFALGQSCWAAGNYREGIEILTLNLPENLTNPEQIRDFATAGSLMIDSLATLGTCQGQLGKFDQAFATFQHANDILAQIQATAFDHMVMGSHPPRALLLRGDWEPAIPMLEKNRKLVIESGMRFSLPWQTGFLGHAKVMAGRIEEGVALLEETLKDCAAIYFSSILRIFLAEALLAHGRLSAALEAAQENLRLCRNLGYRAHEAETLRVVGAILLHSDLGKAEESARQAVQLSGVLGLQPEQAHGFRVLGEIQKRAGDPAAKESIARAAELYRELRMTHWLNQAGDVAAD